MPTRAARVRHAAPEKALRHLEALRAGGFDPKGVVLSPDGSIRIMLVMPAADLAPDMPADELARRIADMKL